MDGKEEYPFRAASWSAIPSINSQIHDRHIGFEMKSRNGILLTYVVKVEMTLIKPIWTLFLKLEDTSCKIPKLVMTWIPKPRQMTC